MNLGISPTATGSSHRPSAWGPRIVGNVTLSATVGNPHPLLLVVVLTTLGMDGIIGEGNRASWSSR